MVLYSLQTPGYSLRKQPSLFAPRHWGRFTSLLAKCLQRQGTRRDGCFQSNKDLSTGKNFFFVRTRLNNLFFCCFALTDYYTYYIKFQDYIKRLCDNICKCNIMFMNNWLPSAILCRVFSLIAIISSEVYQPVVVESQLRYKFNILSWEQTFLEFLHPISCPFPLIAFLVAPSGCQSLK